MLVPDNRDVEQIDAEQIELRPLVGEVHELAALQRVLEGAPGYAHRVTGHPPGPAEAQSLCTALPPGVDYDRKTVYGVVVADEIVGCVDLIRGWPTAATAHIGLLLLEEEHMGRGLGRAAYGAVEAVVRRWPEIRRIRAAVVATNSAVLPFWRRMGLSETGEIKPYQYDKLTSQAIILAKELEEPALPGCR